MTKKLKEGDIVYYLAWNGTRIEKASFCRYSAYGEAIVVDLRPPHSFCVIRNPLTKEEAVALRLMGTNRDTA